MVPEDLLDAPLSDRLTLLELARQENVAPPTTWRWASKGVRGLLLPTVMVGSKRVTTRAAFKRWCLDLTMLANGELRPPATGNRQREAAIERAEHEAAKYGL